MLFQLHIYTKCVFLYVVSVAHLQEMYISVHCFSLSLNSLEGSDEGEYQDPQWSPSKSGRSLSMGTDSKAADFRQGSISPTYYDTTTPPGE